MFIYKIGIITLHKNKFDYKSGVPFLLPFLLFQTGRHLVVVVNSSHELIVTIRRLISDTEILFLDICSRVLLCVLAGTPCSGWRIDNKNKIDLRSLKNR